MLVNVDNHTYLHYIGANSITPFFYIPAFPHFSPLARNKTHSEVPHFIYKKTHGSSLYIFTCEIDSNCCPLSPLLFLEDKPFIVATSFNILTNGTLSIIDYSPSRTFLAPFPHRVVNPPFYTYLYYSPSPNFLLL